MHRFFKISIALLLIAAFLSSAPLAVQAAVYDPGTEGIVSSYYHIDYKKGYILGVVPGTTAAHLLSVCLPSDCFLSTQRPATGAVLTAGDHSLTVIVTGDLDGNGAVNYDDLKAHGAAVLGEELSATALAAADVNYDGAVTITDYLQIKATLMDLGSIQACGPKNTDDVDPLILLSPGANQVWRDVKGAVSSVRCFYRQIRNRYRYQNRLRLCIRQGFHGQHYLQKYGICNRPAHDRFAGHSHTGINSR